jgi:hypothetical protein
VKRREGVEPHRPVAEPPGLLDDRLDERPARTRASPHRLHVEPLHLADAVLDRPEGDAADDFLAVPRDEQRVIAAG